MSYYLHINTQIRTLDTNFITYFLLCIFGVYMVLMVVEKLIGSWVRQMGPADQHENGIQVHKITAWKLSSFCCDGSFWRSRHDLCRTFQTLQQKKSSHYKVLLWLVHFVAIGFSTPNVQQLILSITYKVHNRNSTSLMMIH